MSYCFNPDCPAPANPDAERFCLGCGSDLLLQNRFRAIASIARGGFGRTFLAADESLSPPLPCIVKQFWPQNRSPDALAKAAELFQQEAQHLTELGIHPQIPNIIAYFEQNSQLYLVQELIQGINLVKLVEEEGTFSEAQILHLLDELLPVLNFIHARQIIHRDIKPENIIQKPDKKLVLVDFGAAKVVTNLDLLQVGTSIGSAEYVAPEQAKGKAVFASDLYSLGVTCLYLLTGISPFDLFDVANDRWIWRDYLTVGASDRLAQILDKLLQPALNRRFQSAEEVMGALPVGAMPPRSPCSPRSPSQSWHCWQTIREFSAAVNAIAFSPDGALLASGSDDKMVHLWDVATARAIASFAAHTHCIQSVAFSPDGKILASGSDDKTVKLWEVETQQEIFTLSGHSRPVKSVAFSSDGKILASGSWDKTVKLWKVATGEEICTLTGHNLQVSAIAFSPDGQYLASGSVDRKIRVWYCKVPVPVLRYTAADHVWAVLAIAFSPDSKLLASGSDDNTIKLREAETGKLIHTLSGHSWSVAALAFAPDGETLISGSWDKTVKLWQVSTGQLIATLADHSDSVLAIAFTPDGRAIASASKDKTIKLWQKVTGVLSLAKF